MPLDPSFENIHHLSRIGIDFPSVIASTCHREGIQFWPTVRLKNTGFVQSSLHDQEPDWFFAGYANAYGFAGGYRPMINYEIPEVRALMMRGFRELVERYDADGLQLDFTRYPSLFHPDRAWTNTWLLTDYVLQIRAMLEEVGKAKDRQRTFAVQVAAHPDHGVPYGHDIRTWSRSAA